MHRQFSIRFAVFAYAAIALLCNSFVGFLVSAQTAQYGLKFADQDTMLICTGKQFKWISASAFSETGKLVFVDAPQDAPEHRQQLKCGFGFLADSASDTFLSGPSQLEFLLLTETKKRIRTQQAIYYASNVLPSPRGPPLLS
ncbi:MAG: hypothetical protein ACFHVJ_17675 [Aestuariibacter sp.]